jgi:hypothetical protein
VSDYASIRRLEAADLPAYKLLLAHPEAFTSDAASEKAREPAEYLHRLGLDRREGGISSSAPGARAVSSARRAASARRG